jgi:GMP synthase-like glutamine amidotransferase
VRIGILETDTLEPSINKKYGSYAEMFQRLFLLVDNQIQFNVYRVIDDDDYPSVIDECDAYLVTGSKFSAYEDIPWIIKLRSYIVELHNQRKKLIGICFGHQIIAHALGGLTQKSEKGWGVGNATAGLVMARPWMDDLPEQFSLLVSHQDQVVNLPEEASVIASSDFCSIAAFQIADHILTFQGHPEFTVSYLKYLLDKRRDIIGNDKYDRAISSLKQKNDARLVAQWIVNFISE